MKKPVLLAASVALALTVGAPYADATNGNEAEKALTDGYETAPEGYEKAVRLSNGNIVAFDAHEETTFQTRNKEQVRPAKGTLEQRNSDGSREFTVEVECVEVDGGVARFGGPVTASNWPGIDVGDWRRQYVEDNAAVADKFAGQTVEESSDKTCAYATAFTHTSPASVQEGDIKIFN